MKRIASFILLMTLVSGIVGCKYDQVSAPTKKLHLVSITSTSSGDHRIALLDVQSEPPRTYFLSEGDMTNGIELIIIDIENSRAMLQMDGKSHWIHMGQ